MEPGRSGQDLTSRSARAVGFYLLPLLLGLSACGSPSPEAPGSGTSTGSTSAVVSVPTSTVAGAGLSAPLVPKPDRLSTEASRTTSLASTLRAHTSVSTTDTTASDDKARAEQALRAARERWYAEARESPDVTVRLQALEFWAQQRGDALDPLTLALVDEDESVRTRAQELYEQQLARETQGTGSAVCAGACPVAPQ
jgi:hypothetical protein